MMSTWMKMALLGGVLLLLMLILAPLALAVAFLAGSGQSGDCSGQTAALDGPKWRLVQTAEAFSNNPPPAKFVPIYQAAGAKFNLGADGPSVLAAVHNVETDYHDSGGPSPNSAGATGPMQFLPSTWTSQGQDGNGDGQKDILNVNDAIFAAANYLKNSGAPGDWHKALFAYNHSTAYGNQVLALAKKYPVPATGGGGVVSSASPCPSPGGGGSGYGGYVNPLGNGNGNWRASRTDEGVDWCMNSKEEPIRAIGHAKITLSRTDTGWPGGGFIVYELLDGDHKGDFIYVAEHIKNLAPVGKEVQAGDTIATAIPQGTTGCSTEWGYNGDGTHDLARAYPCYHPDGLVTNSGKEFARFMKKLGAKPQDDPGPGPDTPTGPLC